MSNRASDICCSSAVRPWQLPLKWCTPSTMMHRFICAAAVRSRSGLVPAPGGTLVGGHEHN